MTKPQEKFEPCVILPEEVKDTLEFFREQLAKVQLYCDSQPVDGFTALGQRACFHMIRDCVQEMVDNIAYLYTGLGARGMYTAVASRRLDKEETTQ